MFKRLKNASSGRLVGILLAAALTILILWASLSYLIWFLFTSLGYQGDLWGAIEGLSSAAAFAITVSGGIIILLQLDDAQENNRLALYKDAFNMLMDPRDIEARRWLYTYIHEDLTPQQIEELLKSSPEGMEHLKKVLNSLDYLGFMTEEGSATSDSIIEWMSPVVVKVWRLIGEYIEYQANVKAQPDYYRSVKLLAKRCMAWRNKVGYPDETFTNHAT